MTLAPDPVRFSALKFEYSNAHKHMLNFKCVSSIGDSVLPFSSFAVWNFFDFSSLTPDVIPTFRKVLRHLPSGTPPMQKVKNMDPGSIEVKGSWALILVLANSFLLCFLPCAHSTQHTRYLPETDFYSHMSENRLRSFSFF